MDNTIKIILAGVLILFLASCDQVDELKNSTNDLIQQTMDKADEVIKESKDKVRTATDTILGKESETVPSESLSVTEPEAQETTETSNDEVLTKEPLQQEIE